MTLLVHFLQYRLYHSVTDTDTKNNDRYQLPPIIGASLVVTGVSNRLITT